MEEKIRIFVLGPRGADRDRLVEALTRASAGTPNVVPPETHEYHNDLSYRVTKIRDGAA